MRTFQTRAERISEKNIRVMGRTEGQIVQEHDDPSIKHDFNSKICPHCNVPFINNVSRGYRGDEFLKVCPLCGMNPY